MLLADIDPALDILTGVLVLVTAAAAVAAIREAIRATRSAERSAERQIAIERLPVLADVPQDLLDAATAGDPAKRVIVPPPTDRIAISAPLRNVGRGPAFIRSASVVPANRSGRPGARVIGAVPVHRVLAPGDTTQVTCTIDREDPSFPAFEEALITQFNVLVYYTDLGGEQWRMTNLYVVPAPANGEQTGHLAMGVDISECDEKWHALGEPVVARGPLVPAP